MEAMPLVSIITPVYKSEEFIKESILSIMNQTYKNIELICINDCTPDNSFEICKELSQQYSNIKLCENEKNMGQEVTRNRGIDEASGKYILFFDSDDILDPQTVEKLVEAAEAENSNVVFFTYSRIINGIEKPVVLEGIPEGNIPTEEFSKLIYDILYIGDLSCIGTKLYKTEFINENGIRFDKKYKYNEDGAFFINTLFKTDYICVVNEPYYKYIIRTEGSTMTSYRKDMFVSVSKTRELIKKLFLLNGCWSDSSKKIEYFREMLALMLNSLINEEKFGTAKSFKETCVKIREYIDFDEMYECLVKSGKLTTVQKIILSMIQMKKWVVVRMLVKVYLIMK